MISKILIAVDDINYIDDYRKVGISTFLFPLKDYCVGYNTYSIAAINKVKVSNKYLLINRILDCESTDNLKNILSNLDGIKGLVFEDIAVYMLAKKLNLAVELIFFQNHFQTNTASCNFWLERVDSIFLGNEITESEIRTIANSTKKPVCVHLYGYNQVMYSRRLLLSNWSDEFNLEKSASNVIIDRATKVKFHALENPYGTVMYSGNIYNGSSLLDLDNINFFYVNPTLIGHDIVMNFLSNPKSHKNDDEDNGFLEKETIYKLKEVKSNE